MRVQTTVVLLMGLALTGCTKTPEERAAAARAELKAGRAAFDAGDYAGAQKAYARALESAPSDSAFDGYIITNLATLEAKPVIEAYNAWEGAHYRTAKSDTSTADAPDLLDTVAVTGQPTDKVAIEGFKPYSTVEPNGLSPVKFTLIDAQRRADSAGYVRLKRSVEQALKLGS